MPTWAKDLKVCRKTYNVRTETVHEKLALIPVDMIYDPKYIQGKAHWYGIYRKDGMPFTVAALYEDVLSQIQ